MPREWFGPAELLRWLEDTQDSNERAKRSHAKRRPAHSSLSRRCNTSLNKTHRTAKQHYEWRR